MRNLLLSLIFTVVFGTAAHAADQPNLLWITAEDMSPTLGCYGDEYATTPNIDRFAKESVRYTRAFATAPVCSPSRSALITGCYAPSMGTQQMRSAFPIPEAMTGFPSVLRKQLDYFTTNNVKTDYNTANWETIIAESWDENSPEAHWRKRDDEERPFFSIFNLMTSHQSRTMVWPREKFVDEVQAKLSATEVHDPETVPLPPYYPDTPVVRRELARYYDCVTAMDQEVGEILRQLEEDGLGDDTIVFFYSDHGSGMPRHKRALLDSGMHVPLLIRFPEKWKHLAPAAPGETIDQLVSFVDFGPTVLSLAGAEIPDFMQGKPFLGEQEVEPREAVFGHRDRVDEVRDLARSVRDGRYLYIRNYFPHRSYNQPTAWPDLGEIRHEFYRFADPEKMSEAQWHFAGPRRPVEELYDCEADPQNLKNLAASSEHAEVLEKLRTKLKTHLRESKDVGFLPESLAWETFGETTPWEGARAGMVDLEALYEAAEQVGKGEESDFLKNLVSDQPGVRYWGALGLAASESASEKAKEVLGGALEDAAVAVRVEAANALSLHGEVDSAIPVLEATLQHENISAVLHAMRCIEMLGDRAAAAKRAVEMLVTRTNEIHPPDTPPTVVVPGDPDLAMFTRMSATAFLAKLEKNASSGEWRSLFDGESLAGWEARAEGDVIAKDGEIQILAKGKNLWLVHEESFQDFELEAEVKMPTDDYNSGIGFRCSGDGKPKGYQCEVAGRKTGMIYAIGSGWVWPKGDDEAARFREMAGDSFQPDDWNQIRIHCEGERIQVWVNDALTADVADATFAEGSIALQHHGKGGVHRFRNVRIREIPGS